MIPQSKPSSHAKLFFSFALICLFILSGCGGSGPFSKPTETPFPSTTPTPKPTATNIPTSTSTPTPTATHTPTPTPTLTPTATPFGGFSTTGVIVQKEKNGDIFLYSMDGEELRNLTSDMTGSKITGRSSPDGKWILVGLFSGNMSAYKEVSVWNVSLETDEKIEILKSKGWFGTVWSLDGSKIYSQCSNRNLCIVDLKNIQTSDTGNKVESISVSADGKYISWDKSPTSFSGPDAFGTSHTFLWNLGDDEPFEAFSFIFIEPPIRSEWSPDGESLYFLDLSKSTSVLYQYFPESAQKKEIVDVGSVARISSISPDGRWISVSKRNVLKSSNRITVSYGGTLGLLDLEKGAIKWLEDLEFPKDYWWRTLWAEDSNHLFIWRDDGTILSIDPSTGEMSPTDWMSWTKDFNSFYLISPTIDRTE